MLLTAVIATFQIIKSTMGSLWLRQKRTFSLHFISTSAHNTSRVFSWHYSGALVKHWHWWKMDISLTPFCMFALTSLFTERFVTSVQRERWSNETDSWQNDFTFLSFVLQPIVRTIWSASSCLCPHALICHLQLLYFQSRKIIEKIWMHLCIYLG